jgi:hypothetical protein
MILFLLEQETIFIWEESSTPILITYGLEKQLMPFPTSISKLLPSNNYLITRFSD